MLSKEKGLPTNCLHAHLNKILHVLTKECKIFGIIVRQQNTSLQVQVQNKFFFNENCFKFKTLVKSRWIDTNTISTVRHAMKILNQQ